MPDLFSTYSESVAAHPPLDSLEPKPVSFAGKTAVAVQDDAGGTIPRGRTRIKVSFENPKENADSLDGAIVKGPAGQGDITADLTYDPVVVGKEKVFAASSFGGAGSGDSNAAAGTRFGARSLEVTNPANFAVGQSVRIKAELGFAFARVRRINGSTLELEHEVNLDIPRGAPVQTVNDRKPLALGADYEWADASLGRIKIHDTPATAGKHIGVEYATTLEDFAGGDVLVLPGAFPQPDYAEPKAVMDDPAAEIVGAWKPGQTEFALDRADEAGFGRDITVYFIGKDREATPNRSLARGFPVTILPPIPTGLKAETAHSRVSLVWGDLAAGGALVDGYDIMRSDGAAFDPAKAKKLNIATITVPKFADLAGAPNRISEDKVPAPVNCNTYAYAVVSKIGSNLWDVPTIPLTADGPGQPFAMKKLADDREEIKGEVAVYKLKGMIAAIAAKARMITGFPVRVDEWCDNLLVTNRLDRTSADFRPAVTERFGLPGDPTSYVIDGSPRADYACRRLGVYFDIPRGERLPRSVVEKLARVLPQYTPVCAKAKSIFLDSRYFETYERRRLDERSRTEVIDRPRVETVYDLCWLIANDPLRRTNSHFRTAAPGVACHDAWYDRLEVEDRAVEDTRTLRWLLANDPHRRSNSRFRSAGPLDVAIDAWSDTVAPRPANEAALGCSSPTTRRVERPAGMSQQGRDRPERCSNRGATWARRYAGAPPRSSTRRRGRSRASIGTRSTGATGSAARSSFGGPTSSRT